MHPKLRILLWGSNIWYFAEGLFGPLLAVFAERVGGSILDIAWAWAVYLMVTGISSVVVGRVSDRISKEKLLVLGYSLAAMFSFLFILVRSPLHLFFVQAGLGVSSALSNPTWYALYGKYSPPTQSGKLWGLADGGGKIIMGVAILLGGLLVKHYSFYALFLAMGSIHAVAALYQARSLAIKE